MSPEEGADQPTPKKKPPFSGRTKVAKKLLQKALDYDKASPDNLSLERMIGFRAAGKTMAEIAKIMNCSAQNVDIRLRPFKEELAALKEFQESKADLYDFKQRRLLESIDEEVINRSGLYDRIRAARDLEEMARKVRGLDNHRSVSIFTVTVRAAHALKETNALQIEGTGAQLFSGEPGGDAVPGPDNETGLDGVLPGEVVCADGGREGGYDGV